MYAMSQIETSTELEFVVLQCNRPGLDAGVKNGGGPAFGHKSPALVYGVCILPRRAIFEDAMID